MATAGQVYTCICNSQLKSETIQAFQDKFSRTLVEQGLVSTLLDGKQVQNSLFIILSDVLQLVASESDAADAVTLKILADVLGLFQVHAVPQQSGRTPVAAPASKPILKTTQSKTPSTTKDVGYDVKTLRTQMRRLALSGSGVYSRYGCGNDCIRCQLLFHSIPVSKCSRSHAGEPCLESGYYPHLTKAKWLAYHGAKTTPTKHKFGMGQSQNPLIYELSAVKSRANRARSSSHKTQEHGTEQEESVETQRELESVQQPEVSKDSPGSLETTVEVEMAPEPDPPTQTVGKKASKRKKRSHPRSEVSSDSLPPPKKELTFEQRHRLNGLLIQKTPFDIPSPCVMSLRYQQIIDYVGEGLEHGLVPDLEEMKKLFNQ